MDGTIRLTCEFLHNPLGVQTAHPRFSWYSDEPKGMQAGWRIRVAASEEDLRGGPCCGTAAGGLRALHRDPL